ncbi:thiol:disulfide interchange protein DsbA/DsbL [Stenotrophomonas sp. YIM B06876]|uniref:thiol:disulfide interchange protein DsbA/DsbL n=1 Tax=Stenotrophomonas sp. YIM B06876 TaxID=3060211 RepID=UPI002739766E|nr:thiol:disulfide interchange protein DsbA/DsbL [Stenotrophomonas sp. YIM B06876]
MKRFPRLMFLLLCLLPPDAAAAASTPALLEGRDYELIANPAPFAPLAGKIEVTEVFGYTCGHCAHFETVLRPWVAKLPADVRFTPVPAAFGGTWDAFARAYYAADQLGVSRRSHGAMFEALHDKRSLPMQNVSPQELATFYSSYGVTPQRYIEALRSDKVDQQIKTAREFAIRSGVQGTPTLIVNGKYLVKGRNFEDVLRITDALVARERSAGKQR